MRKSWWLISILVAVLVILAGCDSGGGDSDDDGDDEYSAPTVPAASELPASGATAVPASDEEVIAMYSDVFNGLSDMVQIDSSDSLKSRFGRKARAVEDPKVEVIDYSDEHMTFTGSITYKTTTMDEDTQWKVNTTYNNLMAMSVVGVINGDINEATVSTDNGDYIISGETKELFDAGYNIDAKTGATMEDVTVDMDLSVKLASGVALSVRNAATGVGGKIIISFGFEYKQDNVSMESMDDSSGMEEAFEKETAEVKFYNDQNELLRTVTVTLDELPNSIQY